VCMATTSAGATSAPRPACIARAASTDDITVRDASPDGSEITYRPSIEVHGLAKLGEPVVKAAMERLGDATATHIQQAVAVL